LTLRVICICGLLASAVDHRLLPRLVALTARLDLRFLERAQVVVGQHDLGGGDILLEPVQFGRARDGDDPRQIEKLG
jgi:hypothetical protein